MCLFVGAEHEGSAVHSSASDVHSLWPLVELCLHSSPVLLWSVELLASRFSLFFKTNWKCWETGIRTCESGSFFRKSWTGECWEIYRKSRSSSCLQWKWTVSQWSSSVFWTWSFGTWFLRLGLTRVMNVVLTCQQLLIHICEHQNKSFSAGAACWLRCVGGLPEVVTQEEWLAPRQRISRGAWTMVAMSFCLQVGAENSPCRGWCINWPLTSVSPDGDSILLLVTLRIFEIFAPLHSAVSL